VAIAVEATNRPIQGGMSEVVPGYAVCRSGFAGQCRKRAVCIKLPNTQMDLNHQASEYKRLCRLLGCSNVVQVYGMGYLTEGGRVQEEGAGMMGSGGER
jgi:hypothetical protein